MAVAKGAKRAAGSSRRAKDEDYDEYMAGVPSAAPGIAGASARGDALEQGFASELEAPSAPSAQSELGVSTVVSESAVGASEEPAPESAPVESLVPEPREEPHRDERGTGAEETLEGDPAAIDDRTETPAADHHDSSVVTSETSVSRARSKRVAELALPKYTAGGRPPAADLGGRAPIRQSVTLSTGQVERLQKEVQRRKRAGLSTDLSALCREALTSFRARASSEPLVRSTAGGRLVQQTLYLTQEQVEWLVAEVLRRHALREHADKSSLIRAAIELLIPTKTKSSL
jgi:hypothetical protein